MHKVIGPLSDPGAHGGDPADAFHVVAPSLPGYGFSSPPTERGFNTGKIAALWVELMAALGYDRFGSHGGDWGSAVTTGLGARHPEHMIGIHLAMLAPPIDEASLTPEQREWWDALKVYRDQEWGYVHLQRTKPQTRVVRAHRLPRRPRRVDPREVVAVERRRRRARRARPVPALHARRAADDGDDLLGHAVDRAVDCASTRRRSARDR